MQTPSGQTFVP